MEHRHRSRVLKPRKEPRQQRSVVLVEAIKETCLRILREEGSQALTVARLSEESGVAVTSIYEYFPNIHSVVGTTLQHVRAQLLEEHLAEQARSAAPESLYEYLLRTVHNSLRMRRTLMQLHQEIYTRYVEDFDNELSTLTKSEEDIEALPGGLRDVLEQYRHQIRFDNLDDAMHLAVRMMQAATRATVLERPNLDAIPDLEDRITQALYCLLTVDTP